MQTMQSLQTIGSSVPVRLVVERVSLCAAEIRHVVSDYQAQVLGVQTQYVDALEDFVRAVFVHGIEDAIAVRDAWRRKKVGFVPFLS